MEHFTLLLAAMAAATLLLSVGSSIIPSSEKNQGKPIPPFPDDKYQDSSSR